MNIDIWTKNPYHRKAITALPTLRERLQYIVDHAEKPKFRACAMLNFDEMKEFYYPRLGPFVIRGHSGSDCSHETAKEAAKEAGHILEMLKDSINGKPESQQA